VTQYKKLMPQITQSELLSLPFPVTHRDYSSLVAAASAAAIDRAAGLNGPATQRYIVACDSIEHAILEDLGISEYEALVSTR
jgi:hypothetical protein